MDNRQEKNVQSFFQGDEKSFVLRIFLTNQLLKKPLILFKNFLIPHQVL